MRQKGGMGKVESVREQYDRVAEERCECGGRYRVEEQMLLGLEDKDGTPVEPAEYLDVLMCRCLGCGARRDFTFDVSDLLRSYRLSPPPDLLDLVNGQQGQTQEGP